MQKQRKVKTVEEKIKIEDEFKDLLSPLTEDEYNQLEQEIMNKGCIYPLVLWNGILVDGHHRYKICKEHNIQFETRQLDVDSREDVICWIINNQFGRRNLNVFQRVEIVHKHEKTVKAQAKARQGTRTDLHGNIPPKSAGSDSRDELAKMAGVGHSTYENAVKVLESGFKEIIEAARKGEKSINQAYEAVKKPRQDEDSKRQAEQAEQEAQAEQEVLGTEKEAPETEKEVSDGKKYKILYADCVLDFEQAKQRLKNLPVVEMGEDNSVFLLLATFEHILDAGKIMEANGYSYRTMSYIRDDKGRIRPYDCMCLIGTRGEVKEVEKLVKKREKKSGTYEVPEEIKEIFLKNLGGGTTTDLLSNERTD